MMNPTLIEIAALPDASTLPLELLEDFADATPTWFYLEEESHFVSTESNRAACVIRHHIGAHHPDADFVFWTVEDGEEEPVRLMLVFPTFSPDPFSAEESAALMRSFLEAFRTYMDSTHARLELRTAERTTIPSLVAA